MSKIVKITLSDAPNIDINPYSPIPIPRSQSPHLWITDPPYADAVNYHELSEFFLACYEKHIPKLFPEWYTDSKRALAIKGADADFRKAMVEAYRNLANHMPDNGMQVVMFTHQDAGVWADLALILWASGLKVTAAWTIATETTSALKEGNYVQGTVLLVLRKNISRESAFIDELIPDIEMEVKSQIDSMIQIEDKEEPNFSDTDYQLAAYAAALRVLTTYSRLGDIPIEQELARTRSRNEENRLVTDIENAKGVAPAYLVPQGIDKTLWKSLGAVERFYLKSLDLLSKGNRSTGSYQELARGFGVKDYLSLMASIRANEARPRTAVEFAGSLLDDNTAEFSGSLVRHVLYAIYIATKNSPVAGREHLKLMTTYNKERSRIVALLRYFARFSHSIVEWREQGEKAFILAGLIENDK